MRKSLAGPRTGASSAASASIGPRTSVSYCWRCASKYRFELSSSRPRKKPTKSPFHPSKDIARHRTLTTRRWGDTEAAPGVPETLDGPDDLGLRFQDHGGRAAARSRRGAPRHARADGGAGGAGRGAPPALRAPGRGVGGPAVAPGDP